jgi:protein tyrosine phosphatase (PTP) superfamily phosphohydrolase (DUF442 family)
MHPSRRRFIAVAGSLVTTASRAQSLIAPNVVVISPRLVTCGQPAAPTLANLGSLGFEAVISLVPFTVPGTVKEEPDLLAKQRIEFVHAPIAFNAPDESHFLAVSSALTRLKDNKVLVHCEVNMRASSMVFLHRVVQGGEEPARAYEAVAAVWSPRGPWRRLMEAQLHKHAIKFELY